MQTVLSAEFRDTARGRAAESILRQCVHCGFCNATCPTYELLGDELDGPRGRIYQMKQFLEGAADGVAMRPHLDRCLLCRNCESTCPSGVEYGRLFDLTQAALAEKRPRRRADRLRRRLLARLLTGRRSFGALLQLGRLAKRLAPRWFAPRWLEKVPDARPGPGLARPPGDGHSHSDSDSGDGDGRARRRMLALGGCVQSALAADTNRAAAHVLARCGIELFEAPGAGCCGGVALHTCGAAEGRATARRLIDAWLPHLQRGAEAVVITASGCGVTVKDYPHLFADDPDYRDKAQRVSERAVDLCEVIARELPADYAPATTPPQRVAFHAPCTLQHGLQIRGVVESLLARAGHSLCQVRDAHLCCGSAGTYSILQPRIAAQLRQNKRAALTAEAPAVICTANIGCQMHLSAPGRPLAHWIELLV
ncbi:MAG: glycolate oxidase subunit GlcF [Gammaproteobacteria bacterium]|nr:glycolate oxidase subunit GlcF [Gammaproteobacteria bacterium]